MSKIERRLFATELRLDAKEGEAPVIRGHAAVFNKLSENLGGFVERIRPGAFKNTLAKSPDVRALFNHNADYILGRTTSGTLKLTEDEQGLHYEIDPPDTTVSRDLQVSLKRKDVNQSSFGFYVVTDEWHKENGQMVRELVELDLHNGDVSPVTYPAYPQTSAEARAFRWPEGVPDEVTRAVEVQAPPPQEDKTQKELETAREQLLAAEKRAESLSAELEAEKQKNAELASATQELVRAIEERDEAEARRNQRIKAELEKTHASIGSVVSDISRSIILHSLKK